MTGFFVFFFLLFFQPFGVNNYNTKETITGEFLFGTVLMCIAVTLLLAVNELLVSPFFAKYSFQKWLLWWIVWSIWYLGTGVFLFYNFLGGWHDLRWWSYAEFLMDIGVLSLFPWGALILYFRIRDLRSTLSVTQPYTHQANEGESFLVFTAENQKDRFSLPLKLLLLIEADDNYVFIHHLKGERVVKSLFRKSLKSIQEETQHPALLRCHRSYLINASQLERIQGNRNKLSVFLHHIQEPIPVSRQYADKVLALLSQSPQIG